MTGDRAKEGEGYNQVDLKELREKYQGRDYVGQLAFEHRPEVEKNIGEHLKIKAYNVPDLSELYTTVKKVGEGIYNGPEQARQLLEGEDGNIPDIVKQVFGWADRVGTYFENEATDIPNNFAKQLTPDKSNQPYQPPK